jgi:hypothetical protein
VLFVAIHNLWPVVPTICLHLSHSLLDSSASLLSLIMAPPSFFLSATVLFAQSTVAFNCSLKPIYVDIHKRAVHSSPDFQYGSFIGVGSSVLSNTSGSGAQNHSLWPSLAQNHMSFGSLSYCDNSTLRDCTRSTGGFYDDAKSTTYVESTEPEDFAYMRQFHQE